MTFQVKILAAICALSALMAHAMANAAVEAPIQTSDQAKQHAIQAEQSYKILQDLHLDQAVIQELKKVAPSLEFYDHKGLAFPYKTAQDLATSKAASDRQLILDIQVRKFEFKTDIETVKDYFQKRHNLSYSIIFRVINQQQQVLFEEEQNFDGLYNSYIAYDNDQQIVPEIVRAWIKNKVELTVLDISKSIAKVLPAAQVSQIDKTLAYTTTTKSERNESVQQNFILFLPVTIVKHPQEDRIMRIPGKILAKATFKDIEDQKKVFLLSHEVKPETKDQLYIISAGQ